MTIRTIFASAFALLLCAAPAIAQGSWPENCKLARAAQLPFRLQDGRILVGVKVNDTPRQFAIATGEFASAIGRKTADDLHLTTAVIRGGGFMILDVAGATASRVATVKTLAVGGQVAENFRLLVTDTNLDGVIGPDILHNFDVEIDFAAHNISLFRPHACAGKAVYWSEKYSSVPVTITEQGRIRLPVEVNGRTLNALLDTGAPATLMASDAAKAAPVTALKIGDIVLNNPAIESVKGDAFPNQTVLSLGLGELSKLHLYIAYRESVLYLTQ